MRLSINGKSSSNVSMKDFQAIAKEYKEIINKVESSKPYLKELLNTYMPKDRNIDKLEILNQLKSRAY